jgi:cell fate regulator YaaT (PSP1 superfamily)
MVRVVGVGFKSAGRVYFYDPGEFEFNHGDHVIVEAGKGEEYGIVRGGIRDIPEGDLAAPLKVIRRKATAADMERQRTNRERTKEALVICRERVRKRHPEMKMIDAEVSFDNRRLIFYFTADNRVDFRDLVKELAGVFRKRIELRQVGVRDEAKMLGGVGGCGRGLCCNGWLRDFEPVSIKMAKVQNLSLNPTKISGSCGRLMCCLKYENDIYQEMKKGIPNNGEVVETKEGKAKVVDSNILMGLVKVRLIKEERDGATPEKLSSDVYTFDKDEIRRTKKPAKKGGGGKGEKIRAVNKGIEKALADDIIDILSE